MARELYYKRRESPSSLIIIKSSHHKYCKACTSYSDQLQLRFQKTNNRADPQRWASTPKQRCWILDITVQLLERQLVYSNLKITSINMTTLRVIRLSTVGVWLGHLAHKSMDMIIYSWNHITKYEGQRAQVMLSISESIRHCASEKQLRPHLHC